MALHEIVHEVKTRHRKWVFLKLDFQKVYDRLDGRRGFDDQLITWIMQLAAPRSTLMERWAPILGHHAE
jgi:regulator of sigma D